MPLFIFWPVLVFWCVWCVTALVGSALLTQRLVSWARARGIVDTPNSRSSHTRTTPRGGGLAVVAVVSGGALLAAILHPEAIWRVVGIMLPALLIAAISWVEDIESLKNRTRISIHMIAGLMAIAILGPVGQVDLGSFGCIDLGFAAWPLTLLWIVGLTNAFNFMDGIDGIAGITAVVAGFAIALVAATVQAPAVVAIAAAFAAAALGFLSCNWPPARIFMGDVGSAFCGFLIAVLPLSVPEKSVHLIMPVAVVALWPFIFDTAYTIVRRLRKRENIFKAHRSHLYQRLVIAGWSHRGVSSLYGGLAAMTAALALMPLFDPTARTTADHVVLSTIVIGMVLLIGLVLVAERSESFSDRGR